MLDDDLGALLAAAREATVNAAKWSGAGTVSLFAEVEPGAVSISVRDRGRGFDPAAVSATSLAALAYLTLVGSILAFTTYGWLLRVASLPKVATYAYVNPVVAVILGWLILGEAISGRTILAAAVIVALPPLLLPLSLLPCGPLRRGPPSARAPGTATTTPTARSARTRRCGTRPRR